MCQSHHKNNGKNTTEQPDSTIVFHPPQPPRNDIAPGYCRIVGKIIAFTDKYTVKVEQVQGYGAGFNGVIATGNRIPVLIKNDGVSADTASTEQPVDKPNVGDVVLLDIRRDASDLGGANNKQITFIAYGFKILK